jgi:carbonic anhydrase
MKLKNLFKLVSLIKLLLIISLFTPVFLTTSCGSSAAAEKKKSKKSAEAEEDSEEKSDEEKDEKKEDSEEKSEKEDKKADKKKADKEDSSEDKDDHSAEKDDKKATKKAEVKKAEEKGPSGEEIWADLMAGNKRFVSGKHTSGNLTAMRASLVSGQKPKAIILGCADSRVPPELLFDKNLGELFVIRDAGNIADKLALGSIEYALEHLHAKILVILGHESCGAVNAALSGEEMPTKNLQAIVDKIKPAFEDSKDCPIGTKINMTCVKENVEQSAKDILSNSAVIKKAEKEGMTVIKAVYSLETGEVTRLE